jgi:hypothetical protein
MHSSGSLALPSVHGRALMWLSAAMVATAAWLGINALFPALQSTGIPLTIVRLIIHAVVLGGLWLALERSSIAPGRRVAVWLSLAIPFTLWLIAIWILAVDGTFVSRPGVIPRLPLAIFLPIIIGLALLLASRHVTTILIAAPASWLIALQCYRALGGTFLVGWAQGDIPAAFALPAGIGDVLVGLLALPVAAYVHAGAPRARQLGIAWNILGVLDLVTAITMGALTSPGPLQLLAPERPNALLGAYPVVMIPAFIVPSSILLHALSIRQLRRKVQLP